MNNQLKGILLGITVLAASANLNAQKITLNLAKGQKMKVVRTADLLSTANVMGRDMENTGNVNLVNAVEVTLQDAGNTNFTVTNSKIKVSGKQMDQEKSYDSDSKDNDADMEDAFKKMLNAKQEYVIDAAGKLVKEPKSNVDPMVEMSMGGETPELKPNALYIASLIGMDVKVGTQWADSVVTKGKKNETLVNNYTVKSIEGDVLSIDQVSNLTYEGTMEMMGNEMKQSGTSKIVSAVKVSLKTGLITSKTATNDGSMNIDAGGMQIPVTVKTTSTLTVTAE